MKSRLTARLLLLPLLLLPWLSTWPEAAQAQTSPDASFFITSIGRGFGADLGGLEGADALCQQRADAVGLGTRISDRLQLSIDLLDTYKSKPPTAATKKNDIAFVTAVTATF